MRGFLFHCKFLCPTIHDGRGETDLASAPLLPPCLFDMPPFLLLFYFCHVHPTDYVERDHEDEYYVARPIRQKLPPVEFVSRQHQPACVEQPG